MNCFYDSEQEIEQVVRGFETCATPATDFHHREHLAVAVWYLQTLDRAKALEQMRTGLLRFLNHHGVDPKKYSEEVTVFWMDAVATQLEEIGSETPLVKKCNRVIEAFLRQPARTRAVRVEAEASLAKS